jgi:hypothetical protein
MRGSDERTGELFSYVDLEKRVPAKQPLRLVRGVVIETSFVFFERSPDAPRPTASIERSSTLRSRPIAEMGSEDAYVVALERDTLEA